jgi:formate-dependent nitrite reductase membrane component NrfD
MLTDRLNGLHWTWMIFTEMFLAGIAAGLMISAFLLVIGGRGRSPAARTANLLAFPIMLIVTVLLIVDLGRPERFWHMVILSEQYLPAFKPWSPISLGTWLIMSFTGVSFIPFLGALMSRGSQLSQESPARPVREGPLALLWSGLGALLGLAVAMYSGVLLTVTNIPGWGDAPLLAAVYAASAPVTGIALLVLIQEIRGRADADILSLAVTNTTLVAFWLVVTVLFVVSVHFSANGAAHFFFYGWPLIAIAGAILLGGVVPLLLRPRPASAHHRALIISSACVLLGGLLLRMGVVMGPQGWIQ